MHFCEVSLSDFFFWEVLLGGKIKEIYRRHFEHNEKFSGWKIYIKTKILIDSSIQILGSVPGGILMASGTLVHVAGGGGGPLVQSGGWELELELEESCRWSRNVSEPSGFW